MSRLLRTVAVVSTGALLVIVMPGVAAAKTVSNEKYATAYCGAIEAWLDGLNDVETQAQSASDPVAFRTGALATVDSIIASLQSAAEDLICLAGGGGGSGLFGGGAEAIGGGGGGSSSPTADTITGVRAGNGLVTITYETPAAAPIVVTPSFTG